ncbi:MAG: GNAT family N-acetyltransferase [Opitutaceae bacterium]|nr:GNAT family N-acetyltransferase [Opitutaceae bacterium]
MTDRPLGTTPPGMTLPATFDTERLRFQQPSADDAPAVFANWATDSEVTRYLVWRPHQEVGTVTAYLASCQTGWDKGREFTWLLRERSSRQPIGAVAARPNGHRIEVGYVLGRRWWGQGYMTEALRRLIDECFRHESIHRVWAYCDCENPASARVMEKSGMIKEGKLHTWAVHPNVSSIPRDCWCYAITRDQYAQTPRPPSL